MSIDYTERIPNNVNLAEDRRLQRALESWQPKFLQWWRDLGPVAFQDHDVYLRTAISTDQEGWANFRQHRGPSFDSEAMGLEGSGSCYRTDRRLGARRS